MKETIHLKVSKEDKQTIRDLAKVKKNDNEQLYQK